MARKYTRHLTTQEWNRIFEAVGRKYLQITPHVQTFTEANADEWAVTWELSQFPPMIRVGFRHKPVGGRRAEEIGPQGHIQPAQLTDEERMYVATFVAELAEKVGLPAIRLDQGTAALGGWQLVYGIRPRNYVQFLQQIGEGKE